MKRLFTFVLLFSFYFSSAQKEGYIWYFGDHAGIDFNSGTPVALTNSSMYAFEGSYSMSDFAGNLLFYTDGVTVWDQSHGTMQNGTGLSGGGSSAQGGIIIPMPGSTTQYYIFTIVDGGNGPSAYSIVDITLNGGLGAVTTKNVVMLASSVTEKMTAVRMASGGFWVIQHDMGNTFYAFPVTASGVGVPVTSSTGWMHTGVDYGGNMKASASGDKIASSLHQANAFEIYDFDKLTGIVSNPIFLGTGFSAAYGVCFSPGQTKLYGGNEGGGQITQWDLTAGSAAAIIASAVTIATTSGSAGAIQYGPDKKVYITHNSGDLDVINDPDSLYPACNYMANSFNLAGKFGTYGLPNWITDLYSNAFGFDNTCFGDTTHFNLLSTGGVLGVSWNFDDPASGANNTAFVNNPPHYFTAPGTYSVTALLYYSTFTDTVTVDVTINSAPAVNLGPDSSFCTGTPFTMYAGSGYTTYLWSDNSTDSTLTVTLPGTYWVTVQQNGCFGTDSIVLSSAPCNVPVVNLMVSDTVFCDKNCLDFTDLSTNSPTSWQWFFPGADSTFSTAQNPAGICYNSFGSFDVTLIACNGAGCDTLFLPDFIVEYQVPPAPVITQNSDTLFSTPAYTYAWYSTANPGNVISNNSYITGVNGGSYFVVISDSVGCQSSSTIFVAAGIMETWAGNMNVNWDPVSGMVQVNMPAMKGGTAVDISVTNMLGQEVYKTTTGERSTMIDLSTSRSGIYFIRIITPQGVFAKEIILEK